MLKLTTQTLDILKNFATINPNLVVKEGSQLATIAEAKNIMATSKVAEKFTSTFGVYDLNEFLSALSLVDDPQLEFTNDSVVISDKDYSTCIKYRFANPSVLTAPTKAITMPEAELTVPISADVLSKVRKAASALGHSILAIEGEKGKINIAIRDPKDASSNTYTIALDKDNAFKSTFSFQFLIANLKLLSGDYAVSISSKLISQWKHTTNDVTYFIALEKTSTVN
jgi:hypothetical protein